MVQKFKTSKISLSVAENKIYDETTTFNEQNINGYLAEVEEYIKCLLALMAKQFGFEHPILVALGLTDLPEKITTAELAKEEKNSTESDEEPDDVTLNAMLDKDKYEMIMTEIWKKQKESSKSMVMNSQMEESKVEESIFLSARSMRNKAKNRKREAEAKDSRREKRT